MPNHIIRLLLVVLCLGASRYASAAIDLYQQDFENPRSTTCNGFQGNAETGGASTSYSVPGGVPYKQLKTADRLCISEVGSPDDLVDPAPALVAGNYSIGFHGGGNGTIAAIESVGFIFDPNGYRFLNGEFIASLMGIPGYTTTSFTFEPGVDINFNVEFYEIPPGTSNGAVVMNSPTALGGNSVISIGGIAQTPLESLALPINNSNPVDERFTLDWHDISFSIDLSPMNNASSRVMMVITGLPPHRYLALDNFDITATLNNITLPTAIITVPSGTTGIFDALAGAIDSLNLPLTVQATVTSSDPAAGAITADPATGLLSFTPTDGFIGDVVITFEVCDNQDNQVCQTQTMTFRVIPAPASIETEAAPVPVNAPWALALLSAAILTLAGKQRRAGRIQAQI